MKKEKIDVVMTQKQEVSICPYCGETPIVEVEINKKVFESDTVSHEEVICPCCGLSAPRKVWNALGEVIDEAIAKD